MGWGISFALDPKYRVYCEDGCRWKARARDYTGFPVWPSALETVLEELEHAGLDTAAACDEALPGAMSVYDTMTTEEKMLRHEKKTLEFDRDLKQVREALASAQADYKAACALGPPKYKRAPKSRADELERQIAPLKLELAKERAAMNVDTLTKMVTSLKRLARLENKFSVT